MSHNHNIPTAQDDLGAITVTCWLTVALPQDLAEALDHYAATLGPGVKPAEAVRQMLRSFLLGRAQTLPLAM